MLQVSAEMRTVNYELTPMATPDHAVGYTGTFHYITHVITFHSQFNMSTQMTQTV